MSRLRRLLFRDSARADRKLLTEKNGFLTTGKLSTSKLAGHLVAAAALADEAEIEHGIAKAATLDDRLAALFTDLVVVTRAVVDELALPSLTPDRADEIARRARLATRDREAGEAVAELAQSVLGTGTQSEDAVRRFVAGAGYGWTAYLISWLAVLDLYFAAARSDMDRPKIDAVVTRAIRSSDTAEPT